MPRAIKRNNVSIRRVTIIHCHNVHQRSATNFKAQRPGVYAWWKKKTIRGNLTEQDAEPFTLCKIRSLFHLCKRTNACYRGQTLNHDYNLNLDAGWNILQLLPINSPVLLAERKWLLLAIASYMSPCNATEHSLFKIWIILMPRAQSNLPFNVLFNVNLVAMDETQTLVR